MPPSTGTLSSLDFSLRRLPYSFHRGYTGPHRCRRGGRRSALRSRILSGTAGSTSSDRRDINARAFDISRCSKTSSGCSAAWLARLTGGQKAGGSNPLTPTILQISPFGENVEGFSLCPAFQVLGQDRPTRPDGTEGRGQDRVRCGTADGALPNVGC
jgi:hypothetical protein